MNIKKLINREPKFDLNIEIPFDVIYRPDDFDEWIKRVADIQKECGCNCTISITSK